MVTNIVIKNGIIILLIILEIYFGIKASRASMKQRRDEALTYAGILFTLSIVTFSVIQISNIIGI